MLENWMLFFSSRGLLVQDFFAENIWVQVWLIVAHMDLQPDNTYLEKVAETGYMGFTFWQKLILDNTSICKGSL